MRENNSYRYRAHELWKAQLYIYSREEEEEEEEEEAAAIIIGLIYTSMYLYLVVHI